MGKFTIDDFGNVSDGQLSLNLKDVTSLQAAKASDGTHMISFTMAGIQLLMRFGKEKERDDALSGLNLWKSLHNMPKEALITIIMAKK